MVNANSADTVTIQAAAVFGTVQAGGHPAQIMRQKQTPLFTVTTTAASQAFQLTDGTQNYSVVALQVEQDSWIAFGGSGVVATAGGATNTWFFTRGQYLIPVPFDSTGVACTYLAVLKYITAGVLQCMGVA